MKSATITLKSIRNDREKVGVNPMCKEVLPEIRRAIVDGEIRKAGEPVRRYYKLPFNINSNFST